VETCEYDPLDEKDLSNLNAKCVTILKKLDKELRELQSVVSSNNTKREIKDLTGLLFKSNKQYTSERRSGRKVLTPNILNFC
jgi:hypothetical protein